MELFELTDPAVAGGYAQLTYPSFRPLLKSLGANPSIIAIAAGVLGRPVGLGLAEIGSPDPELATIRSLYVTPELRGTGLGTALLERTEAALLGRGCRLARLTYPAGKPTTPALEQALRKRGWTPPWPRMLLAECEITRGLTSAGRALAPLPEQFQIAPWSSVATPEIKLLAAAHQKNPWIPSTLLPWNWENGFEPRTSLALRRGDEIVGWLITHQVDDESLRYSCGWVREDLQHLGRVQPFLHLLGTSFRQAIAAGYRRGIWYVSYQQPRMLAVSLRRGLRSGATLRTTMHTEKDLRSGGVRTEAISCIAVAALAEGFSGRL